MSYLTMNRQASYSDANKLWSVLLCFIQQWNNPMKKQETALHNETSVQHAAYG